MSKRLPYTLFVYTTLIIQSCNFGSDGIKRLNGGYYYRNEGGEIRDILCEKPSGGEIPSTVLDFDFDNNFIIAKQKPKVPQDPMYSKEYVYKDGIEEIYFWLIILEKNLVLGPMNKIEFATTRKEQNVPENLELK